MRYAVFVKPGSKKGPLIEVDDNGSITVYLRERAVDGKANQALLEILAEYLHVSRTALKIVRGHATRYKTVEVVGRN